MQSMTAKELKDKNTSNVARAYYIKGKYKEARLKFEKWLAKYPTDRNSWLDYGATLYVLGYPTLGYDATKKALELDPSFGMAMSNIGLYHQMHNDAPKAMKWFGEAAANGYPEANFNYSLAKLARLMDGVVLGETWVDDVEWTDAWLAYGYRFKKASPVRLPFVLPSCDVWGKEDEPVMIIGEQGIGDNVMFSRYFSMLPTGSVFAVPADQHCLFPNIECITMTNSRDDIRYYSPAGSLPLYFSAAESRLDVARSSGSGIGVCWKGNAEHSNDRNRSYPNLRSDMLRLGRSLVYGDGFKPADWVETIEVIEELDVIITVDTSLAHVAGRMGKRVMILQPRYDWDFRWGTQRKNIWYPTVESYATWEELLKNI